MPNEDELPIHADITGIMAGTTIASIMTCKPGSVQCIAITNTNGDMLHIKFMNGRCEIGGTNEWGTGDRIL